MKLLNTILEIIASPFSFILRNSGNGKNYLTSYAKVGIIVIVSLLIVALLVLFYYRDFIFTR